MWQVNCWSLRSLNSANIRLRARGIIPRSIYLRCCRCQRGKELLYCGRVRRYGRSLYLRALISMPRGLTIVLSQLFDFIQGLGTVVSPECLPSLNCRPQKNVRQRSRCFCTCRAASHCVALDRVGALSSSSKEPATSRFWPYYPTRLFSESLG